LRARRQGPFVASAVSIWVLGSLVLTPTAGASTPRANQRVQEAREVRTVWTSEFGIPRPIGLAYRPERSELLVAEARGDRTAVLRLSLGQDPRGTFDLPRLSHPSTLAFDPTANRLTAVSGAAQIAASASDLGNPRVRRTDIGDLGLRDPAAATFDPSAGRWFVLDGGADAVVSVPRRGGLGSVTRTSLTRLDASRFAGIAFNPSDGLLYVADADRDLLYGLDGAGKIRKTYSLASLDLRNPRAMTFAPSADRTDDPDTLHLYVADSGDSSRLGGVTEVSLASVAVREPDVTASLVQVIDTSRWAPASPDPAGITYIPSTDHLMIADSEVDETTGAGFHGVNLWRTTRTGTVADTGDVTSYTKEPTGLGYDAGSNTLFISTDSGDRVYVTKPGTDGRFGTSDDNVTFINAGAYGSTDTEDPEFDPTTGHLFFVDGTNAEVYRVDPVNGVFGDGNDLMTHFDVGAFGAADPEGLGSDPRRGTLLVGDRRGRMIYEVTKTGELVRIIDASEIAGMEYISGLAMAPSSVSGGRNYWIVDRAIDNGADSNENDGKIYEVSVPSDDAPPSASITSPADGATVSGIVQIQANASDDKGVTQVRFFDGATLIGTDTVGTDGWSVSWNTIGAAEGPHTIRATATDTFGQTGSDAHTVTVDNVDGPPTVSITSPADGATVSGIVQIQANASDDKGVTQVRFFDGATSIGTDTDGSNGWSASWDTTGASEGSSHAITATATDTIGQTGSDSHTVTVDNVDARPTVSITSPAQGTTVSGTVQIQANASDDKGVTQVRFFDGATLIDTDTDGSNGWSRSWNTVGRAEGNHSLTAVATDTASQTTTSAAVNVTVRNAVANLLKNPGFEGGRTWWSNGTVVTSPVHSGTRALLMTPSSSGARHSNQTVAVTGGVTYQASGWVKTSSLSGGGVIRIQWRNASGTLLRTDVIGTKLTGTADWKRLSASRTAPSNATQARFMLRIERESDGSGRAWFDDTSFQS
jgi:hypothetical protein